jgi:hypothetical protein
LFNDEVPRVQVVPDRAAPETNLFPGVCTVGTLSTSVSDPSAPETRSLGISVIADLENPLHVGDLPPVDENLSPVNLKQKSTTDHEDGNKRQRVHGYTTLYISDLVLLFYPSIPTRSTTLSTRSIYSTLRHSLLFPLLWIPLEYAFRDFKQVPDYDNYEAWEDVMGL